VRYSAKLSVWLIVWFAFGLRADAANGTSGTTEPGSTQWSNEWYGTISNVLALDYDVFPSSMSVDNLRRNAFITFSHSAPYVRKVSLDDLYIEDSFRWNHALGTVFTSAQMSNTDQTLFLSRQVDHSFLIEMSNSNDQIVHAERMDCLAAAPLVYSEADGSVFFKDSQNAAKLYRYRTDVRILDELILDAVSTQVTDLIINSDENSVYALSADFPGDILQICTNSFQVMNSITIPGNLRCKTGLYDQLNNQLIIIAEEQYTMRFTLVQICLDNFTTGIIQELSSDITSIYPAGICGDSFVLAVSGASSEIIQFSSSDFEMTDWTDCSDPFGHIGYAGMSGNTVIVIDNNIPANIETFSCDTMNPVDLVPFPGEDGWLYCMAINPVHSQLMISRKGFDPATLVLVDLDTFTRSGEIDYDINDDGWFLLLETDADGQFTYGYHTGTQEYLVRICNNTYQVDTAEPADLTGYAEQILVDDTGSFLFVIHGQTLGRYDLDTLQLQEELVIDSPPGGTLKTLMLDHTRDRLIVGNSSGQVFKISKTPMTIIDETIMTETQGQITSGIIIPDKDLSVFAFKVDGNQPALLTKLNLESFVFTSNVELVYPELDIKSMIYDDKSQILKVGIYDLFGGIVSFKISPFNKHNSSFSLSFYRFVKEGAFDIPSAKSYWLDSFSSGKIARTSNHGDGHLMGSRVETDIPVNVNNLAWYSHHSGGSVRLAVYDDTLQKCWESPEMVNDVQEEWLSIPISSGFPGQLHLDPGEYWLVFQVNGTKRSGSAHSGHPGDGIRQSVPFGMFPDELWYAEYTSDQWTIYAEWEPLYPTSTPTATPTAHPTSTPSPTASPSSPPVPTVTPTSLPTDTPSPFPTETPAVTPTPTMTAEPDTPVPTESPVPTETPSPVPTSTPETAGVELMISQSDFQPGDVFRLDARIVPEPDTLQMATLWIILDVYGSYWFGPGWTQSPDCYILPEFDKPVEEKILYFVWPDNCGEASGLAFWGAVLNADSNELIGDYDKVYFSYQC
jgi:hypothetical protein